MADNPVQEQNSASVPVPSDNQIEYQVDRLGKPAFPTPGMGDLTGHQQTYDAAQARAAAARYAADQAAAAAKSAAQQARDAGRANVKFTPAPKRGK